MPRLRSNIIAVYIVRPASERDRTAHAPATRGPPLRRRLAEPWAVTSRSSRAKPPGKPHLRELDEETGLDVERWFRIDRPETFYNPENDTIYLVPAFAALVSAGSEPAISDEHRASRWQNPNEAAATVDWAAMRDSILLVGEALADPDCPGLGVTEMYPNDLGVD